MRYDMAPVSSFYVSERATLNPGASVSVQEVGQLQTYPITGIPYHGRGLRVGGGWVGGRVCGGGGGGVPCSRQCHFRCSHSFLILCDDEPGPGVG